MLFLVDSCIPARQWTDICNTRCSILSRFSHFHVSHFPPLQSGAANSCLAFSTPATWCRIFMSRNFMSRIFSVPTEPCTARCAADCDVERGSAMTSVVRGRLGGDVIWTLDDRLHKVITTTPRPSRPSLRCLHSSSHRLLCLRICSLPPMNPREVCPWTQSVDDPSPSPPRRTAIKRTKLTSTWISYL